MTHESILVMRVAGLKSIYVHLVTSVIDPEDFDVWINAGAHESDRDRL